MTRSELNADIDEVYDDNRADESLAPSAAGAKLKQVADYVEQETVNLRKPEYRATFTLNGANQPVVYNVFVDTMQMFPNDPSNANHRSVYSVREGVGLYSLRIKWKDYGLGVISIPQNLEYASQDGRVNFSGFPTNIGSGGDSTLIYPFETRNLVTGALEDPVNLYINLSVKLH